MFSPHSHFSGSDRHSMMACLSLISSIHPQIDPAKMPTGWHSTYHLFTLHMERDHPSHWSVDESTNENKEIENAWKFYKGLKYYLLYIKRCWQWFMKSRLLVKSISYEHYTIHIVVWQSDMMNYSCIDHKYSRVMMM